MWSAVVVVVVVVALLKVDTGSCIALYCILITHVTNAKRFTDAGRFGRRVEYETEAESFLSFF